jgi:hypothetical protein
MSTEFPSCVHQSGGFGNVHVEGGVELTSQVNDRGKNHQDEALLLIVREAIHSRRGSIGVVSSTDFSAAVVRGGGTITGARFVVRSHVAGCVCGLLIARRTRTFLARGDVEGNRRNRRSSQQIAPQGRDFQNG